MAAFLSQDSADSPTPPSKTDTLGAAGVSPNIIDYVVAQTIQPFGPYGKHKESPLADEDLEVRFELNKETYDQGEPIIATLEVTNISSRTVEFQLGGDYRAGRSARFTLSAVHESGRHQEIYEQLKRNRILVRFMQFPGAGPHDETVNGLRITVGTDEEVAKLFDSLKNVVATVC